MAGNIIKCPYCFSSSARIANEYNGGYCKFCNGIGYVKEIIVPLNDKEIEEIIKDYNEFNSNFKKID